MAFSAEEISCKLHINSLTIDVRSCVSSTNTILKQMGKDGTPHGYVLAAAEQTAGRGRMGRSFFSPNQTGVYFSILLRPNLSPADSLLITTAAAVACAKALENISGKKAQIKWVNDIYIDEKKICGILTEAAFNANGTNIDYAVLGIGINLQTPEGGFPNDIKEKAGGLFHKTADDLRSLVVAEVLNEFFLLYPKLAEKTYLSEYRSRSMLDGKPIFVLKSNCTLPATALYIDENLSLVVRYEDGTTECLSTGDVSIRPL